MAIKKTKKPPTIPVGLRMPMRDVDKLREDAKKAGQTLSGRILFFLREGGAL